MKRNINIMAIALLCNIVLFGCKKESSSNTSNDTVVEALDPILSDEDEAFLASLPQTNYNLKDIVLPNGERVFDFLNENFPGTTDSVGKHKSTVVSYGVMDEQQTQKQKNSVISLMLARARYLTNRESFAAKISDEGENKPDQPNGLAYVWGSKYFDVRRASSSSMLGVCTQQQYGLDCSGFIYQLSVNAGLQLTSNPNRDANAEFLRKKETWENAFKAKGYDKLHMEDYTPGTIQLSELESGDIIYWLNSSSSAYHIGMILEDDKKKLAVFMSSGKPSLPCDINSSADRGPKQVSLKDINDWGHSWGILRIVTDISGKWQFHERCTNYTYDIVEYDLDFPTNDDADFTIEKDFIDYDGSPSHTSFKFHYDKMLNILSCVFTTTDGWIPCFVRVDSFSQKLEHDDTGYFPATFESLTCGTGCNADVRLESLE